MDYVKIHDAIVARASLRIYDSKLHQNHHVIPIHEDETSATVVAVTLKEHALLHHLRYKMTGTLGNKLAWKFINGLLQHSDVILEICSEAGKVGGRITKSNNLGIFNPDYDRSAQSKLTWSSGIMDTVDFSAIRIMGGTATRDNKRGIFREDLQHLRKEWSKIGTDALAASGNRSGICNETWRNNNRELVIEICSKAGSIGGKVTGAMSWWNNGTRNTRAVECPEGWTRGMLMSEKKRAQVMGIAGHNRRIK